MTLAEIEKWVWDRINLHRDYTWSLDNSGYIARLETGETYEYRETRPHQWSDEKTITIRINGKTENISRYISHNFGWKLVQEEYAA